MSLGSGCQDKTIRVPTFRKMRPGSELKNILGKLRAHPFMIEDHAHEPHKSFPFLGMKDSANRLLGKSALGWRENMRCVAENR